MFATLPELIDPPAETLPMHASPEVKMIEQLRFIFIGAKHWRGWASRPADTRKRLTCTRSAPKQPEQCTVNWRAVPAKPRCAWAQRGLASPELCNRY